MATQRSFYMIAIVLVGVMVDRPAVTLRTLAIAAIVVLLDNFADFARGDLASILIDQADVMPL